MRVEVRAGDTNADGSEFSFPVLHGEAGIFTDRSGFYVIGEGE